MALRRGENDREGVLETGDVDCGGVLGTGDAGGGSAMVEDGMGWDIKTDEI